MYSPTRIILSLKISQSGEFMPRLFDPLTLRGVTLRNRVGISPMCMYSYVDGYASDWTLVHLGSRASGGAGLVIAEATAVEARGRITPEDLGIWSDAHAEKLAPVTHFIRQQGAVPGIQIAHAGRKASTARTWASKRGPLSDEEGGWPIVGASPLPFGEGYRTPHELTVDEIRVVQLAFRDAAIRARDVGFRLLELHGAHGYLINSFLSPLSNHRADAYGGSFDNRTRFLLEIVRLVRAVWPDDLPLSVRLSCVDWLEGGWTLDDSIVLSRLLKAEGVDVIDCSSGSIAPGSHGPTWPGYQVPFAEAIRHAADIPTMAVGLIDAPTHAAEIVASGRADIVLLGRASLRDPHWPIHAAHALGVDTHGVVPSPYHRLFDR